VACLITRIANFDYKLFVNKMIIFY